MANIVKIKGKPVGLFGLELALNQVKQQMREQGLEPEEAAHRLLAALEKKNYIPAGTRQDYIKALEELLTQGRQEDRNIVIRILGPGCVGCNKLEQMVLEVLSEGSIAADIFHVTDRDEIFRYGVEKTPALIIGDKVVSAGRLPTKAQIQMWLQEALS